MLIFSVSMYNKCINTETGNNIYIYNFVGVHLSFQSKLQLKSGFVNWLIPWTEVCVRKAEVDDEEHDDEDADGHSPLSHATHLLLLLLLLLQSDVNNSLAIGNPGSS